MTKRDWQYEPKHQWQSTPAIGVVVFDGQRGLKPRAVFLDHTAYQPDEIVARVSASDEPIHAVFLISTRKVERWSLPKPVNEQVHQLLEDLLSDIEKARRDDLYDEDELVADTVNAIVDLVGKT